MSDRDRYRKKTPPAGVQAQLAVDPADWDDVTGQTNDPDERARRRGKRDTPDRLAHIEARLDNIAEQRRERFDRIDAGLERIGTRIDGYNERVITAENTSQIAWDALVALGPKLEHVAAIGGDVKRLADGMDHMIARADVIERRVSAVEVEQRLAAQKFQAHDERDQKMENTLGLVANRVGVLEVARAIDDNTARVKKLIAIPRWYRTPWIRKLGLAIAGLIAALTAYYLGAS